MKKDIQHLFVNLAFLVIMMAGFAIFFILTDQAKERASQSQAYSRFNACALSLEEDKRYEPEITKCWQQAEADAGVQVKRYNEQKR
jgi:hypothetical protein